MDITRHLPWPIGVVLALVAYGVLHYFATKGSLPTAPEALQAVGGNVGKLVLADIVRTASRILQYVIPLVLLVGAGMSFVARQRQRALYAQVAGDPATDALEKMSWQEFEGLVAETFRRKGFRVSERGGAGPDGGVDLIAYQGADKYVIQCKQWKTRQVGVTIVRELYGVMTATHAVGALSWPRDDLHAMRRPLRWGVRSGS